MIGVVPHEDAVHFLLLGHSQEHIHEAIDRFRIQSVVIFTSRNLFDDSKAFAREIEDGGVKVLEVIALDPFNDRSVEKMTMEIINRYDRYIRDQPKMIVSGLTGGTNLMAISMALAAMLRGLKCHYMVKSDEGNPIEIDLFEKMNKADGIEPMMSLVRDGAR